MSSWFPSRFPSIFVLLSLSLASAASGAVEVDATINSANVRPNQVFDYTITIRGGSPQSAPQLRLPLQLTQVSAISSSRQIQIINGVRLETFLFTYDVVGSEPGEFVIPAQEVSVGDQVYQTNEVKVTVGQDTSPQPIANPGEETFLQLEIGKTEIYQGELVPLSASLLVPRTMGLRRFGLIEIDKNDFAIQRFPQQAEQSQTVIGGIGHNIFTFRTTLSALRTGNLKIGPATQEILVEVMMQDRFGRSPFGFPFAEPRKIVARSQQVPVNVIPLPEEGKPAGFTGAVGSFALSANASPTTGLKVGDPISLEFTIEGKGNFDALGEPVITDSIGWKTYPSRRYNVDTQIDPTLMPTLQRSIGYSTVLVPEKVHSSVPPFEISFFDPDQKKYVVLRTNPIPLSLAAGTPSIDSTTLETDPMALGSPPPASAPLAIITDILTDLPQKPTWVEPGAPEFTTSQGFWLAQLPPIALLLGAIVFRMIRSRRSHWQKGKLGEIRQAWQRLQIQPLTDQEFLQRASQFLLTAGDPAQHDRPEFAAILKRYADLNFSGPAAKPAPLNAAERQQMLHVLAALHRQANQSSTARPASASAKAAVAVALGALFTADNIFGEETPPTDPNRIYSQAQNAFAQGDFKKAQYLAESLVKDSKQNAVSPEVFELIGHARYRSDDPGRAALWYQRAALLNPRDPELRQNLRHLDEQLRFLRFQNRTPFHDWSLKLSNREWLTLASVAFWISLLAITSLILQTRFRTPAIVSLSIACVILFVSIGFFRLRPSASQRVQQVMVVTAQETRAHTAATQTSGSVIDLPAGSQTRLLEVRGAWSFCEIPYQPDPLRGWVENSALTPLWPFDPGLIP